MIGEFHKGESEDSILMILESYRDLVIAGITIKKTILSMID